MFSAKAKAVDVAKRADNLALIFRKVSLTTVLDQEKLVTSCNLPQGVDVARIAKQMHGDNRPRPWRDLCLDVLRIKGESVVNVGEYGDAVV